jgi:hypothetical protein
MPNAPRRPASERFWEKVDAQDGAACWRWTACQNNMGYGTFRPEYTGTSYLAHRLAYVECVGPIPTGFVLDHLCRNRACVNPLHLEPVTQRVNLLRGNTIVAGLADRTHCSHGHSYEGSYLYRGSRQCRACNRIRCAARLTRKTLL